MADLCVNRDPDCSGGWVPVIQVIVDGSVVDERPFGLAVIGDDAKRAAALEVGDGQIAVEAVTACRGCRPGWVHPSQRKAIEDDTVSQSQVRGRQRAAWFDDGPDVPPAPTTAPIPLGPGS